MTDETVVVEEVVLEVDPYEVEARRDNWVPKEEFKGPEEAWVDAKTFVERGKQINAILRSNNERLLRQLDEQKRQMEGLRLTTEEFKKFVKEQTEQKLKLYENEIKSLKEEKKQAVTNGDGDRVVEIDDRIDELKSEKIAAQVEEKEVPQASQAVEPAPEVKEWVNQNSWYTRDSTMQAIANKVAEEITLYQPEKKGKDFFDALDSALEKKFTLEALGREAKKTKPRNPVEGASSTSVPHASSGDKKTYDNLPADAKKECDRFIKEKLIKSRDEYVALYDFS